MTQRWQLVLVLAACLGYTSSAFGEENLNRSIEEKLELQSDGTAVWHRTETVPESALKKIYIEHAQQAERDDAVESNYVGELSKGKYLLLRAQPDAHVSGQDTRSSTFTRKVEGKIPGAARSSSDGKSMEIAFKKYDSEKQEKELLAYHESTLDGRFFETLFLDSVKGEQTITSENTTAVELPSGSKILNLKELSDRTWKVDFGGGNTMDASLEVDEKNAIVTLREKIVVTEDKPDILLNEKNQALFDSLRDYASYTIRYSQPSSNEAMTTPVRNDTMLDFSGSWSFGVSHTFSHDFTWQNLTVTPSATVGLNFGASLYWEHYWKKTGWFSWSWTLKKFETTINVNPSVNLAVNVNASASAQKDWDTNIITKNTVQTFFVACVPVTIVLEAKLDMGATANIQGDIGFNTSVTIGLNTSLTTKYEGGWSSSFSKSFYKTPISFTADAKIQATARGEAPITLSAYVYYVAGPFAQLVPYIQGDTWAQAGTANQLGYKVVGGFDVNAGVSMSGWLKSLLGGMGSYSKTLYNYEETISSGTKTF
jgi:hypothetical protein